MTSLETLMVRTAAAERFQALVVRRSVGSALVGMAVGVAGATLGAPVLQRVLDDGITRADDPLIAVLCASVAVATGVASLLPARRALRIPLAAVLRS
jgi:hypothetical protein